MASSANDLVIPDLRGGMNNQDPKHILSDDQCVLMENVEVFESTLGERRKGMEPVDLTGSDLDLEDAIVHLGNWTPQLDTPAEGSLFGVAATIGSSTSFAYRTSGVWTPVIPVDAPTNTSPVVLNMRSVSAHSKWFVAYDSAVDRTHVWDGTTLRRVGLAAPSAAPTAANSGVAGALTGDRIYRVRTAVINGGVISLMSEPSPELSFTPSGTSNGVVVTRPSLPGESENYWIIEAADADDPANFYQLSQLLVATTTYTDTVTPVTDYPNYGDLSPEIGEYDVPPSVAIIKVDEDRLIYIGSFSDPELGSRVSWTPVYGAPGYGNDERVPSNIDSFKDLDWQTDGPITDASDPVNGAFYIFKWGRIYKAQRTGNADDAYSIYLLDPTHGALPGSVVSGVDEYGRAAVYFIDPSIGPMRVSSAGVEQLQNIQATWRRVNTAATQIAVRGLYYPDKKQVHWWVAVDGGNVPSLKLVLQTSQVRSDGNGGTTRGWSIATGDIAEAWTVLPVAENVTRDDGTVQLSYRPYMGFNGTHRLQVGDVGSTDNGVAYRGHIVSKPYILAGLLNRWGAMNAGLLAAPQSDPTITLNVTLIRDFGKESNTVTTDFVPAGSEDPVIKIFDQLVMSDARAIQLEFYDPLVPSSDADWQLFQFAAAPRAEARA